jgi:hypothetical protein
MFKAAACDNNNCGVCVDDEGYHDMTQVGPSYFQLTRLLIPDRSPLFMGSAAKPPARGNVPLLLTVNSIKRLFRHSYECPV